jgi:2,3-bisphosphoglycerate-dependent phosphoglycerate mutase
VSLSETGENEAMMASKMLDSYLFDVDAAFTSTLGRAQKTAQHLLLKREPQVYLKDYRLNERHYGALQGTMITDR